jgi:hypothetical protein
MKTLKGTVLNFSHRLMIVINTLYIYIAIRDGFNILSYISGFLFLNFIGLLITYKSYHYFICNNDKITIKNL